MTEYELNQIIQAISYKTIPKIIKELDKVLNDSSPRESLSLVVGRLSNIYSFNDVVDTNELIVLLSCYFRDETWLYYELNKLDYKVHSEIDISIFFDDEDD